MGRGLAQHFDWAESVQGMGGSSYWVRLAQESGVDTDQLARAALDQGILIEPGSVYYADGADRRSFRLGFSSIDHNRIDAGLMQLAALAKNRFMR